MLFEEIIMTLWCIKFPCFFMDHW